MFTSSPPARATPYTHRNKAETSVRRAKMLNDGRRRERRKDPPPARNLPPTQPANTETQREAGKDAPGRGMAVKCSRVKAGRLFNRAPRYRLPPPKAQRGHGSPLCIIDSIGKSSGQDEPKLRSTTLYLYYILRLKLAYLSRSSCMTSIYCVTETALRYLLYFLRSVLPQRSSQNDAT
jgi:hypothetical protein